MGAGNDSTLPALKLGLTHFNSPMTGVHCLQGFNGNLREPLKSVRLPRSRTGDPKNASATIARFIGRLHTLGLIARIAGTRLWCQTHYARRIIGPSVYLRGQQFPQGGAQNRAPVSSRAALGTPVLNSAP